MFIIPVLLAVVGAVGLAAGTHLQHRVVRTGASRAWRQPRWLLGGAVIAAATALNVVALGLAPVSIVQPIGALALIVAVVISARSSGLRITAGLAAGIVLTVLAVAAFVAVSAGHARDAQPTEERMLQLAALLCGCIAFGLLLAASRVGHHARVAAAGVVYGAVASAMHVVAVAGVAALRRLGADGADGADRAPHGALILLLLGLLLAAALAGLWLVQTAYASGPPETVLAGLTVLDPLVAVGIGMLLLGEYAPLPPPAIAGIAVSGAAAAAGIVLIARHHPELTDPAAPVAPHRDAVGAAPQNRRS